MRGYIYAIYYDYRGYRHAYIGSTMRSPMQRFIEHRQQWRKGRRGGTSSWRIFRCAKEKENIRFGVMEVLNNTTEAALRRVEQVYIDTFHCVNYYIDYDKRLRKRPRVGLPQVKCSYSYPLASVDKALLWSVDSAILSSLSDEQGDTYSSEAVMPEQPAQSTTSSQGEGFSEDSASAAILISSEA